MNKILITGGCGFIGVNLIDYLLKKDSDTKIRVLDDLSVGSKEDFSEVCSFTETDPSLFTPNSSPSSVELIVGDIRDHTTCLKACKGIEAVVHLAAQSGVPTSIENPLHDCKTNVIGTLNMLEACSR